MERPIAYTGENPYIFVSYSHKDSDRVWPIIARLQADRFRVWYDDGINPGTEWDANIAAHIKNCSFFLAFISENYLASDNCKDELSFVRDLKKNRVLVYLEEVTLPDEMQMRLGRLQAIYWPRLGDERAHKKLIRSVGLDVCREPIPAPAAPEPTAETIAPAAPAQTVDIPGAPAKPPVSPAKTASPPNKPTKKFPLLFAGIGAAILLILVVVFIVKPSDIIKRNAASEWDITNPESLTGVLSVYKDGVVRDPKGSLLAGVLTVHNTFENTLGELQELDYNGDRYIVARFPFITISSYDDQNSIILGFYDEFGEEFYFYGTYAIDGEALIFSPGGSAGSFDRDCAPLTEELTYDFNINTNGINISYGKDYISLHGYPEDADKIVLKGSLSKGSSPYKFLESKTIKSIDLVYNIRSDKLVKCDLLLEDNGVIENAIVTDCKYNVGYNSITLEWDSIKYTLNGRTVTKNDHAIVTMNYICQNPVGFMIIKDYTAGNYTCHYYQEVP